MSDGEVDFDGFLLGHDSDTSSHDGRSHRHLRTDRLTNSSRQYSSKRDGDNIPHSSTRNADRKDIESWDKHGDKRRRQAKREELAIVLSSGDDESSTGNKTGSRRLKPSLSGKRENACISPLGGNDKEIGCYQPGEEVESRFGGRSKWFPGRIRRTYEAPSVGVVYDIAYDDGDKEDGVLAARVRRPGQKPPEFHAGLQVDIKLGRKGKGYHHGVIGRVNDDGSLYIKFDDGDAEWSLPVQNAIPNYPFTPTPGISTTKKAASSSSVDANSRTECDSSKSDDVAEKDGKLLSHAPSQSLDQPAPNNDITSKPGPSLESSPTKDNSDAHRQTVLTSEIPTKSDNNPTSEPQKPESSGLSWITAVANSVERSNPPVSGQPKCEESGTGETKPVGNPYTPFSTGGQFSTIQGMPLGVRLTEGSFSASVTAHSLPTYGSIPSVAGTTSISETRIPSHLSWTPSKHSTAGRRWGAPPPDDQETMHAEQLPSQRLLKSEAPAQAVALKSAYSIPTTSHTAEQEDEKDSNTKIAHKTGDNHIPISEDHRLSQDVSSAGSEEPSKQDLTNEIESGNSMSQEHHDDHICGSGDKESLVANHGEATTVSEGSAKSTYTVNSGSQTSHTQLTGEADPGRGGGSAAISRNDMRASVQRRYAADAVHLSEEVRLLRAKLRAADDSARAKLAQQARDLKEQMQEALKIEREKSSKMMSGERAACARRVSDLRQENDMLKRQLSKRETELAVMTARVENPDVAMGRRYGSPTCEHATSTATHRNPYTRDLSRWCSTASTKVPGGAKKLHAVTRPRAKTKHVPPSPMINEAPARNPSVSTLSLAETMKASAGKKEGSLYENLERLFVEGMASRDQSIRALTARLEELEGKREGGSVSRPPSTQPDRRDSKSTTAACFRHQQEETLWHGSRTKGASGGARVAWGDVSAAVDQSSDSDAFFFSGRRGCSSVHEPQIINEAQQTAEALRRRLTRERKETRMKLESMKEEVARVVQQSLARADRAEAAAASAEETARTAMLRYLTAEKERKE